MADERRSFRVLVADDHPVFRQGLERVVRDDDRLDLVAACSDGRETLDQISRHEPDVALIDVRMPGLDGLKIVSAARRDGLKTRFVLITGYEDQAVAARAFAAGAAGYVSKTTDHDELKRQILDAARGKTVVSGHVTGDPGFASHLSGERPAAALTERERSVLTSLAAGEGREAIATGLGMTVGSLQVHIDSLFEKLGVGDRDAAVAAAMRRGLLG